MGSRLLAILTVAVLTSGGLVFLNKEQTVNTMKVAFADWMDQHAIEYATAEENVYRFAVFQENLAYIQEENSNQNEYTLGANKFMCLSQEEFRAIYLGYKPQQQVADVELNQVWQDGDVDWRNKSAVTPIKDQGQCGSCWAFSATGSMESSFFLFGKVPLPSLSESQLVDCSKAQGNQGCNGGLMDQAFTYAMSTNMTTEADYPYVPKTRACNKAAVAKGTFSLSGFTDVTANDVAGLQAAVTTQPVSVAVDANNWQFYTSGVFSKCNKSLDHGVLAVGFSSTFWIVKNSWGTGWGENGFIRLKTGNTCGVAAAASTPQVVAA